MGMFSPQLLSKINNDPEIYMCCAILLVLVVTQK